VVFASLADQPRLKKPKSKSAEIFYTMNAKTMPKKNQMFGLSDQKNRREATPFRTVSG
jgi:hypothetical protein